MDQHTNCVDKHLPKLDRPSKFPVLNFSQKTKINIRKGNLNKTIVCLVFNIEMIISLVPTNEQIILFLRT